VWGVELGFVALGLICLSLNFLLTTDSGARRRIRVIFWGLDWV